MLQSSAGITVPMPPDCNSQKRVGRRTGRTPGGLSWEETKTIVYNRLSFLLTMEDTCRTWSRQVMDLMELCGVDLLDWCRDEADSFSMHAE